MQVIFPGTFDPPTNGHLDLMRRAARMFGRVVVVIAVNPDKAALFTAQERLEMVTSLVRDLPNVEVHVWQGLIVEFARREGIHTLLRGVRALSDFEYEFELSMMNKALFPRIETIFLPTDQKYFVLRSSGIKEVARFARRHPQHGAGGGSPRTDGEAGPPGHLTETLSAGTFPTDWPRAGRWSAGCRTGATRRQGLRSPERPETAASRRRSRPSPAYRTESCRICC